MAPDPFHRLQSVAEVVLRVGLNLQPAQPLLITDPYDLLGIPPEALPIAEAVRTQANTHTVIVEADPVTLRAKYDRDDLDGYVNAVAAHTRQLHEHLASGGAFLFLTGAAPGLLAGISAERLVRFRAAKWQHLGPIIQQLIGGAAQWTLVPAPTADWASAAGTDLAALWDLLGAALRVDAPDPIDTWRRHLDELTHRCAELNSRRHRRVRYFGPGTDLTVDLPRSHRWCTAQLATTRGLPFVVNLPTEEVYTAPHRASAEGRLQVARPICHDGVVTMEGVRLEFRAGRVTRATADRGEDHLRALLATDSGAGALGEIALVPTPPRWAGGKLAAFHHPVRDENVSPHVALGDAYRFCSRAWWPLAMNVSAIHVDLPVDAEVELT